MVLSAGAQGRQCERGVGKRPRRREAVLSLAGQWEGAATQEEEWTHPAAETTTHQPQDQAAEMPEHKREER